MVRRVVVAVLAVLAVLNAFPAQASGRWPCGERIYVAAVGGVNVKALDGALADLRGLTGLDFRRSATARPAVTVRIEDGLQATTGWWGWTDGIYAGDPVVRLDRAARYWRALMLHEFGHVVGVPHNEAGGLMDPNVIGVVSDGERAQFASVGCPVIPQA